MTDTTTPAPIGLDEAASLATQCLDAVDVALVGRRASMELVLAAVLARGHVLLEDLPGLGDRSNPAR